jgi:hypothetical protein
MFFTANFFTFQSNKMSNPLFDLAQKTTATTKATKAKHETFVVADNGAIDSYVSVCNDIDNLTAQKKGLEDTIKQLGKQKFVTLYGASKPDNFRLQGDNGTDSIMFIAMDKYGKIDENKLKALTQYKLDGFVETKKTVTLDEGLVEKYGQEIFDAIMSMPIPDDEKAKLVQLTETKFVRKGAIDELHTAKIGTAMAFTLLQPVLSLKR